MNLLRRLRILEDTVPAPLALSENDALSEVFANETPRFLLIAGARRQLTSRYGFERAQKELRTSPLDPAIDLLEELFARVMNLVRLRGLGIAPPLPRLLAAAAEMDGRIRPLIADLASEIEILRKTPAPAGMPPPDWGISPECIPKSRRPRIRRPEWHEAFPETANTTGTRDPYAAALHGLNQPQGR